MKLYDLIGLCSLRNGHFLSPVCCGIHSIGPSAHIHRYTHNTLPRNILNVKIMPTRYSFPILYTLSNPWQLAVKCMLLVHHYNSNRPSNTHATYVYMYSVYYIHYTYYTCITYICIFLPTCHIYIIQASSIFYPRVIYTLYILHMYHVYLYIFTHMSYIHYT